MRTLLPSTLSVLCCLFLVAGCTQDTPESDSSDAGAASDIQTQRANLSAATADWSDEGGTDYYHMGESVAGGDLNGDGIDDLVVGVPWHGDSTQNRWREGALYVYLGSSNGLATTPTIITSGQWEAELGNSVAVIEDINGDGFDEVIAGAHKWDVDISSNYTDDDGAAFLYYGSASGLTAAPAQTFTGANAGDQFGTDVASGGDVDGDDTQDVLVSTPLYSDGETEEGGVWLYNGSTTGLTSAGWIATSNTASSDFGTAVAIVPDIDQDNDDEILVGAPGYGSGGTIFVYYGDANGPSTTADWTEASGTSNATFGNAVAAAGDVNGDGYGDFIVGSKSYGNGEFVEGGAAVYAGSATGLSRIWFYESDQTGATLGTAVGSAGDFDGDGFDDVIVGAGKYDDGVTDEGAAFVFLGSSSGLGSDFAWKASSANSSSDYGSAVGGAWDFDDDNTSDVVVGAPNYQNGNVQEGAAFAYYGGGCVDRDGDSFAGYDATSCPSGTDCDDTDATVFDGATELCDGQINDCSTSTLPVDEVDDDSDGYVECAIDSGGWDGTTSGIAGEDCDDSRPGVNPGETEVCDDIDNNCDGQVDEGLATSTYCDDSDGDGYGDPATQVDDCQQPTGYVTDCTDQCDSDENNWTTSGCGNCADSDGDSYFFGCDTYDTISGPDCNDTCGVCYPSATEVCDGEDNNCDGTVDEGCSCSEGATQNCYTGPSGTAGVGVCTQGTQTCTSGSFGTCENEVTPGTEGCNGDDDDCDGVTDEGCQCDYNGTSEGVCGAGAISDTGTCDAPASYESNETSCDTVDNDCDGVTDEGCACDYDSTAEGVCSDGTVSSTGTCDAPSNYEADETSCDAVDNDCDGDVDEGCDCVTGTTRACYSGAGSTVDVGVCQKGTQTCTDGAWGGCENQVTPTDELCDGNDNDCDGETDEAAVDCNAGEVCESGSCVPDGADAGDTGTADAGDTGTADTGDTGVPDTGAEDTGTEDTGTEQDTGTEVPDTGTPDAGDEDTGTSEDTGQPDAGPMSDTGVNDTGSGDTGTEEEGCGCGTVHHRPETSRWAALLLLLSLGGALWRRRG